MPLVRRAKALNRAFAEFEGFVREAGETPGRHCRHAAEQH
jgi:hypothetical protein